MKFNIIKIQKKIDTLNLQLENLSLLDEGKNIILLERERLESNKDFIIQMITVIIAILSPILTMIIFYVQNNLAQLDFQLRMRPYITSSIVRKEASGDNNYSFIINIKNSGVVPAIVTNIALDCPGEKISDATTSTNILIGNNEVIQLATFTTIKLDRFDCQLDLKYRPVINLGSKERKEDYENEYIIHYMPRIGDNPVLFDHFIMSEIKAFK